MSDQHSWQGRLVARLVEMSDPADPDLAALAHLRRGLGFPLDYTLSRVGWLFAGVPDWAVEEAVLVAGLFALTNRDCPHSRPAPKENEKQRPGPDFGSAFGGKTKEEQAQREKRFIDLLDTGAAELPHKLRQAVTLMIAREGTRLDWHQLIDHLIDWSHSDRWVQKVWARGFWANRTDTAETDEPTTLTPTVSQ
jgi:CRISPR type I-E-associated protein CasB/Cse2